MTTQPPLRVVVLLTVFNAVSSVLYASLPFLSGGYERWSSELSLFLGPPDGWAEAQLAMLGAFAAGTLLTPDLIVRMTRWMADGTPGRWKRAMLQGVLRGYGVVIIACALGPLLVGFFAGRAGPEAAGALVPLGLLAGLVFAVVTTPIVLCGGSLNGLACMAVVARAVGRQRLVRAG
jgi:hypothetical protein